MVPFVDGIAAAVVAGTETVVAVDTEDQTRDGGMSL